MEIKVVQTAEKQYSYNKAASNTVVNSIPVVVIALINYLNKHFNLELDDITINAIATLLAAGFYWFKNWIKNRNKL